MICSPLIINESHGIACPLSSVIIIDGVVSIHPSDETPHSLIETTNLSPKFFFSVSSMFPFILSLSHTIPCVSILFVHSSTTMALLSVLFSIDNELNRDEVSASFMDINL